MKTYLFVAAACMSACLSCRDNGRHTEGPSAPEVTGHENEIVISPKNAEMAGIKVSTINPGPFKTTVRTSGTVISSETTITAASSGIISWDGNIPAKGLEVTGGQTVGHVSGKYTAGGDEAEKAAITYKKAAKEYDRARELHRSNIISDRELESAEAEFRMAESAYESVSARSSAKGVAIVVPASGRIAGILKGEGEYVTAGEAVASMTKNGSMRLRADLPEKYARLRDSVVEADFRLAYCDGLLHAGRRISAAGSMGASPYISVTFDLPDNDGILPGSHADVWLVTGSREDVISVPQSALTEEQGEYFVYLRKDVDCYVKTHVTVGGFNGNAVEILSGLHGGEQVVTEGAYQVKLSSARVIPGHSHEH